MRSHKLTWAVILAAGEGRRLAALTLDQDGHHVPKQFCSLSSGHPLVQDAVQRALYVAQPERICVVVADQHRQFWEIALPEINADNLIVQPKGCGTANGVLLATLNIFQRDPGARIIFLPADHYVRDEAALGASLQKAATLIEHRKDSLVLVGIKPEDADCELGYIVPGTINDDEDGLQVTRFVEKPEKPVAQQLLAAGAVWNSFIFAAAGTTLLNLIRRRTPETTDRMSMALQSDAQPGGACQALADLYQTLPSVDFSHDILEGAEASLSVVTAPACGWTDLGTPRRVAGLVHALQPVRHAPPRKEWQAHDHVLDLAIQCQKLGLCA